KPAQLRGQQNKHRGVRHGTLVPGIAREFDRDQRDIGMQPTQERRVSLVLVERDDLAETTFFFPSRRRHTSFDCDWSSDVCSSDLPLSLAGVSGKEKKQKLSSPDGQAPGWPPAPLSSHLLEGGAGWSSRRLNEAYHFEPGPQRSEERRVGRGGALGGSDVCEESGMM